ncbi:nucleoside/nucleotide kinase family protein [Longispora sp. NPDC051575]|uniref:nucleoside/nucleotide kinase family protein n=1 Tax=Longispora sp. NPDC051575 TaxID=3154943 RepID=UPI003420CF7F
MTETTHATVGELVDRARRLAATGGRRLLGVTGPPGAGKSTLAEALVTALTPAPGPDHPEGPGTGEAPPGAVLVPMDGFHLADIELARLGRRDRKGAPDTFDGAGFVALLRRVRADTGDVVYAPAFDRTLEEPVAGSIPVRPGTALVVTEGNYLLVDEDPWSAVRGLLDEVWYLDVDEGVRLDRLVGRHVAFGKSRAAARDWAHGSDGRNAAVVAATRVRADVVVRVTPD